MKIMTAHSIHPVHSLVSAHTVHSAHSVHSVHSDHADLSDPSVLVLREYTCFDFIRRARTVYVGWSRMRILPNLLLTRLTVAALDLTPMTPIINSPST